MPYVNEYQSAFSPIDSDTELPDVIDKFQQLAEFVTDCKDDQFKYAKVSGEKLVINLSRLYGNLDIEEGNWKIYIKHPNSDITEFGCQPQVITGKSIEWHHAEFINSLISAIQKYQFKH